MVYLKSYTVNWRRNLLAALGNSDFKVHLKTPLLGILGGMGPLATADFYAKLIRAWPAERDQDHIPVLIVSDPRVPDRSAAIRDDQPVPVRDALIDGLRRLERGGATAVAIPCNTAHFWLDDLRNASALPVISIVDAALEQAMAAVPSARSASLLATEGTRRAHIYDDALAAQRLAHNTLTADEQQQVLKVIAAVKAGRGGEACLPLRQLVDTLHARSDLVFLACTELPLAASPDLLKQPWLIDTTAALVEHCLAWYRNARYQKKDAVDY